MSKPNNLKNTPVLQKGIRLHFGMDCTDTDRRAVLTGVKNVFGTIILYTVYSQFNGGV